MSISQEQSYPLRFEQNGLRTCVCVQVDDEVPVSQIVENESEPGIIFDYGVG